MFLDNHYTTEYYDIITRNQELTKNISIRKIKELFIYTEKHHVIPKSLGGSNLRDNIVYMSAKDHYRCHQLLINMTEGTDHGKMWSSLWRMMNKQSYNQHRDYEFTANDYEQARIAHANSHSERMLGKNNPFYNQKHTAESLKTMSLAKKGKTYEEIFGTAGARLMRERRRQEQLGKKKGKQEIIKCKYCVTKGGIGIMKRWHHDNCKFNTTDVEVK